MTQARVNGAWAGALIEGMLAGGARQAVVSPGSRHTPVVLALHHAAQMGQLRIHTVLDERTAGFFALGLARMTGEPTLLACTSGSAGGHYLPALIEASHDRLPLIAMTADRPPELQGRGAPQTTMQSGLFEHHVRLFEDPGAPGPDADMGGAYALAQRAIRAALGDNPGPVHLNLPFRKPLWGEGEPLTLSAQPPVTVETARSCAPESLEEAAHRMRQVQRGLLVCGPGDLGLTGAPREEMTVHLRRAIARLADTLSWPVVIDGASCLRGGDPIPHAHYVGDCVSRSEVLSQALAPELIVRLGQIPTSTPLRRFLAKAGKGKTLLLDATGQRHDPDGVDADLLPGDPTHTLESLASILGREALEPDPSWAKCWSGVSNAVTDGIEAELGQGPLWAGTAVKLIAETLPKDGLIHLASSLAVRAFDTFAGPTRSGVQVTSNRGVNGIDGTLATAFGQAAAWRGPVAVIAGDLAFLHDLGSLATLAASWDGSPWVCVVLDNQGGGIFDHLPIANHPSAYDTHFVTPQRADISALAGAMVSTCVSVATPEALRTELQGAFARPEVTVIHAPFSRELDLSQHHRCWALGAQAGEEALL